MSTSPYTFLVLFHRKFSRENCRENGCWYDSRCKSGNVLCHHLGLWDCSLVYHAKKVDEIARTNTRKSVSSNIKSPIMCSSRNNPLLPSPHIPLPQQGVFLLSFPPLEFPILGQMVNPQPPLKFPGCDPICFLLIICL